MTYERYNFRNGARVTITAPDEGRTLEGAPAFVVVIDYPSKTISHVLRFLPDVSEETLVHEAGHLVESQIPEQPAKNYKQVKELVENIHRRFVKATESDPPGTMYIVRINLTSKGGDVLEVIPPDAHVETGWILKRGPRRVQVSASVDVETLLVEALYLIRTVVPEMLRGHMSNLLRELIDVYSAFEERFEEANRGTSRMEDSGAD